MSSPVGLQCVTGPLKQETGKGLIFAHFTLSAMYYAPLRQPGGIVPSGHGDGGCRTAEGDARCLFQG